MACFAQLRDNVPDWILDTNRLAVHVYTKRAEFAEESRKLASSRKRKAPISVSSSSRESRNRLRTPDSSLSSLRRSCLSATARFLSAGTKRRKGNGRRSHEKLEQVVLYDAHTQKVLEEMVRQIWSSKSSIRAARITSSMRAAFKGRLKIKTNSEWDDGEPGRVDNDAASWDLGRTGTGTGIAKESPFDFIETQLDSAQSLCESAAYRFLREGDCLDELDAIVQTYEMILEASTTMAEKMEAEERQHKEEEEREAAAERAEQDRSRSLELNAKHNLLIDGADDPADFVDTVLEVDDRSSTSSVSIDISAFRLTRYGQGPRTMQPFSIGSRP